MLYIYLQLISKYLYNYFICTYMHIFYSICIFIGIHFLKIVLQYIEDISYAYETRKRKCTSPAAPEAALSLRDKFVRDSIRRCLLSSKTFPKDEGSFGTSRDLGPTIPRPGLGVSSLYRLSSNFQRFDGRLISKIYEPFASSLDRAWKMRCEVMGHNWCDFQRVRHVSMLMLTG